MISRVGLAAALVVLVGVAVASATRQPPSGTAMYVVRVDPRLCPSPSCGGYWVALANAARTRCDDGLRRPRCYAATVVEARGRAVGAIADGALVRASLHTRPDDLGLLRASAVYAPAGTSRRAGGFYRIVDTGIRCVRAPCFSYRATQVNGRTGTTLSEVDLTLARASAAELARAQRALRTKNGLYAQGVFVLRPAGGRQFAALRLFLRAPLARD